MHKVRHGLMLDANANTVASLHRPHRCRYMHPNAEKKKKKNTPSITQVIDCNDEGTNFSWTNGLDCPITLR